MVDMWFWGIQVCAVKATIHYMYHWRFFNEDSALTISSITYHFDIAQIAGELSWRSMTLKSSSTRLKMNFEIYLYPYIVLHTINDGDEFFKTCSCWKIYFQRSFSTLTVLFNQLSSQLLQYWGGIKKTQSWKLSPGQEGWTRVPASDNCPKSAQESRGSWNIKLLIKGKRLSIRGVFIFFSFIWHILSLAWAKSSQSPSKSIAC